MKQFFEGWYYKQQSPNRTLALIPGRTGDSAFIQVITNEAAYNVNYPLSTFRKTGTLVQIGNSQFTQNGIDINITTERLSLQGALSYKNLSPLAYDIMGPFRFFPMECRHTVVSMNHTVSGSLQFNGQKWDFDGGRGYIEGDSGRSFPSSYSWVQCNVFDEPCSVMISVARIPFAGLHFTGCISSVWYGDHEYRLATYRGVQILQRKRDVIELRQGPLRLRADMTQDLGHALSAPIKGAMCRTVHETPVGSARFRFWERDRLLFDKTSKYASFEYVQ